MGKDLGPSSLSFNFLHSPQQTASTSLRVASLEAWTDSLLDMDRVIRQPIRNWVLELLQSIDLCDGQRQNKEACDLAISIASNNYALMLYMLGQHELAELTCHRQIRFSNQYSPAAVLQPHINLIRLHRGIGHYQLAQQLLEELLAKSRELTTTTAILGGRVGSEFVEEIYFHENFLLTLKVAGPRGLPDLLGKIEVKFPVLGETAAFAERMVMAGMLCKDAAMVNEGLSKASWKTSSHNNLARAIYASYWMASQGDRRQAVLLVQRMAGLEVTSYQSRDHTILRILERLFALAQFVEEDKSADQLNEIRARVAGRVCDVYVQVVAAYHRKDRRECSRNVWRNIASRSGYKFIPGIPNFPLRKRTLAANQVLLSDLDTKIRAIYRSYEASGAAIMRRMKTSTAWA